MSLATIFPEIHSFPFKTFEENAQKIREIHKYMKLAVEKYYVAHKLLA
jgi:hypothetical protein